MSCFLSLYYISTLLWLFQLDFCKFSAVVDLQRAGRRHLGTDALGKLSPELFAEKKYPGNENSDFPPELENLKTNRWRHFNVGGSSTGPPLIHRRMSLLHNPPSPSSCCLWDRVKKHECTELCPKETYCTVQLIN